MTNTGYGRFHVPETEEALPWLHFHAGQPLKEVDHEPPLAVLDQENLLAQDIHCSQLVHGAQDVDALGSCTANATTAALSRLLDEQAFQSLTQGSDYNDTRSAEEWAIEFYHQCTSQTGRVDEEWPPTDCGSSGPYVVRELSTLKLVRGAHIAHGAQNIVSLMQSGGLIVGQPFMNSWETPDANGFIDGDGSVDALQTAIDSGVAGGHETYWSAIEKLTLTATGKVDPFNTIIRARNSWSNSWGDNGDYRFHLSTFVQLGNYCDMRLLVV